MNKLLSYAIGLLGFLASSCQEAGTTVVQEEMAPGVIRLSVGEVDRFTPYGGLGGNPMTEAMERLPKAELPFEKLLIPSLAASFVIGAYDGFYGPGTGTFLILVFAGPLKMHMKHSAGISKVVNLAADIGALLTFTASGKVNVALGVAAALFCMAGSYFGSGLVVNNGQKIVRPVILTVLVLLFAKILVG